VRDYLLSATPLLGSLLMIATKILTRFGSPEGCKWNPRQPLMFGWAIGSAAPGLRELQDPQLSALLTARPLYIDVYKVEI
jgi:hypothetical protein